MTTFMMVDRFPPDRCSHRKTSRSKSTNPASTSPAIQQLSRDARPHRRFVDSHQSTPRHHTFNFANENVFLFCEYFIVPRVRSRYIQMAKEMHESPSKRRHATVSKSTTNYNEGKRPQKYQREDRPTRHQMPQTHPRQIQHGQGSSTLSHDV